jgi:hypothetical protein
VFDVIGDVATGTYWSRDRTHCNDLLCSIDLLALTLLTGNKERIDSLNVEVVVIPVETILELPICLLIDSNDSDGVGSLPLSGRRDFALMPLAQMDIGPLTNVEGDPAFACEHPWLEVNPHIICPA